MQSMQLDLSKYIGFTVGIGIGIVVGLIAARVYDKSKVRKKREDLIKAIVKLSAEVEQLQLVCSARSSTKTVGVVSSSTTVAERTDALDDDDETDVFFELGNNVEDTDALETDSSQRNSVSSISESLKETDKLREGSDDDRVKSYNLLTNLANQHFNNCDVLWRLGRAQYDMAMISGKRGNQDEKEEFMKKCWYGIAVGNYCEFVGSQEKIKLGYEYKEHIEKAIKLNPDDPSAYSLLGRWCYEVSMLPWYMRKVATAVFGEPPSSSVDEALHYAMKSEELRPNFWKENLLLIAKCYYQKSDYSSAREWLEKAKDLPVVNEDDSVAQKEIMALMLKV
eukprot:gene2889-1126_t